jgi:predicted Zn-dependent protease with MMP-like domain
MTVIHSSYAHYTAWLERLSVLYDGGMYHVEPEHFEKLVTEAIDAIPEKYAKHIKNLAFVIEGEPSLEQRQKLRLSHHQSLFGLYEGLPITKRANYNLALPDKITIFRHPIEWFSHDQESLTAQIKQTVWHEVAHYFGLDHGQIHELEKK